MVRYISVRIFLAAVTVVGVSVVVFVMARLSGDVVTLLLPPEAASRPEDVEALKQAYGLDKSQVEQYFVWIGNLLGGDFGDSIRFRQDTIGLVIEKLPNTLKLGAVAGLFALVLGVGIGVISALRPGSIADRVGYFLALLGQAAPNFVVAILAVLLLSVEWGLLPTSGIGGPKHFVLPALSLGMFGLAALVRLTRSAMLEVLDRDHVKLARLNGVPERSIIWKHALKNAFIPVLTLFSVQLIFFVSGSVIIETIFAWPGLGRLTVEAINARDYPLVQTIVLVLSVGIVLMNLIVDLLYAWIDPRIRLTGAPT